MHPHALTVLEHKLPMHVRLEDAVRLRRAAEPLSRVFVLNAASKLSALAALLTSCHRGTSICLEQGLTVSLALAGLARRAPVSHRLSALADIRSAFIPGTHREKYNYRV